MTLLRRIAHKVKRRRVERDRARRRAADWKRRIAEYESAPWWLKESPYYTDPRFDLPM